MKALVYKGPGKKAWEEVADPNIQKPTDVIVEDGGDHDLRHGPAHPEGGRPRSGGRDESSVTRGSASSPRSVRGRPIGRRRPGHPVVRELVRALRRTAVKRTAGHCLAPRAWPGIGWIFGYMIDGTQAEYVRVPFAENSVYRVPEGMTESEGIFLSDILPTGFEIGVQYGQVSPGDVVA